MKSVHTSLSTVMIGLLASLFLLPNCGRQEEPRDAKKPVDTTTPTIAPEPSSIQDVVLASINGTPLMTKRTFEDYLNQIDEAQPGAKEFISQEPQMEQQFLSGLIDQKIIRDYWVKDQGLDQTPEYQKTVNQCMEMCTLQVAHQKFEESILKDFELTDADVKKYYNDNKKRFVKTPGGVKALEVVFSDEKAAQDFLDKAKAPGVSFQDLAQKVGKSVQDLGAVTRDNMNIDPALKTRLLKVTKVPAIDLIKVGKDFHVAVSTDKIDEEYQTFEEAKELAKQIMTYEKFPQMVQEKKNNLKKQYNVVINEDYFNQKRKDLEKELGDTMGEDDELMSLERQGGLDNGLPLTA